MKTFKIISIFLCLFIISNSSICFASAERMYSYDFTGTTGTVPSYSSGTGVITDEGSLDTTNNKISTFNASDGAEYVYIKAQIKGTERAVIKLYDGENYESIAFTPDDIFTDLVIKSDNNNLTVIYGSKQLENRKSDVLARIDSVSFSGVYLDNLVIGEQTLEAQIVNPNAYIYGDTIGVDYIFFKPNGETKPTCTYKWYSHSNGTATEIGSDASIEKPTDTDTVISCEITYNGKTYSTPKKAVADLDVLVFNYPLSFNGKAGVTFRRTDSDGNTQWNPSTQDWSGYDTLIIRSNSNHATQNLCRVTLSSKSEQSNLNDYFYSYFSVDWEDGYKDVAVDFKRGHLIGGNANGFDNISGAAVEIASSTYLNENADREYIKENTYVYVNKVFLRKNGAVPVESGEYIANAYAKDGRRNLAENIIGTSHPKMLLTSAKLSSIKAEIDKNDNNYIKKSFNRLKTEVDAQVANGALTVGRSDTSGHLAKAALLYNIEPTDTLKNWIWDSITNISTVDNWCPESYLSLGDTTRAMAFTYDWMYNHWTNDERLFVRNAIMAYGINPSLSILRSGADWAGAGRGNWNNAINSGLGLGAIAICDNENYAELTNEVLELVLRSLEYAMRDIEDTGAYMEGISYWEYAMSTFLPFEKVISEVCGYNGGLTEHEGLKQTGYFPMMLTGATGTFNFADAVVQERLPSSAFYRLSEIYNNPDFGAYQYSCTESRGGDYMSLLLYNTAGYGDYKENMPHYKYFPGKTEAAVLRQSWADSSSAYLGFKGGDNNITHAQLDTGSFVYDNNGVRWFSDLGNDSYTYVSSKYELYRNRAEGNNCLVINPDTEVDQVTTAKSTVTEQRLTDAGGYGIVDMSQAYAKNATSAKRGFALINNYSTLIIQDEIKADDPIEFYSFLHTKYKITVSDDKKSAVITYGEKSINVKLLAGEGVTLSVMDAELMKLTATVYQKDNSSYKKLAVHGLNQTNPSYALVISANDGADYKNIISLDEWKTDLLKFHVASPVISVNNKEISGSDFDNKEISDVSADLYLANETKDKTSCSIIIAAYNGDSLTGVTTKLCEVDGGSILHENFSLDSDSLIKSKNADNVRLFIWKKNLQPLNQQIEVKRSNVE